MLDRLIASLQRNDYTDAWKRNQYAHLAGSVARHVEGRTLVDVGCAEGLLTTLVGASLPAEVLVLGMDLQPHPLWPRARTRARFVAGDASRPPLATAVAGVVLAKDLLHHASDPGEALRWLTRLASRRVIIVEANAANPIMALYTRHNGDRHYDEAALLALLTEVVPQSAITCEEVVAYPFYLPPVRTPAALWIWPVTAVMLLLFKVLRLNAPARVLHRLASVRSWPPPFMIRSFDVERCHPTIR
ncbi:MAG: class I SAM-dependent methyltransferase [Actinomycetota bacterium]